MPQMFHKLDQKKTYGGILAQIVYERGRKTTTQRELISGKTAAEKF
jgi:hypothetical protein